MADLAFGESSLKDLRVLRVLLRGYDADANEGRSPHVSKMPRCSPSQQGQALRHYRDVRAARARGREHRSMLPARRERARDRLALFEAYNEHIKSSGQ